MSESTATSATPTRAAAIAATFRRLGEYGVECLRSLETGAAAPDSLPISADALAGAIRWTPLGGPDGGFTKTEDMERTHLAALLRLAAATLSQEPLLTLFAGRIALRLARDRLGADPSPRSMQELAPSLAGMLALWCLGATQEDGLSVALVHALEALTLTCGDQLLVAVRIEQLTTAGRPPHTRAALLAAQRCELMQLALGSWRAKRDGEPLKPRWRQGELAALIDTWSCGAIEALCTALADPESPLGAFPCAALVEWLRAVGQLSAAAPALASCQARIVRLVGRIATQHLAAAPHQALIELARTTGLSGFEVDR